jgi:DNA-binding CsgD family transcriptional regulator
VTARYEEAVKVSETELEEATHGGLGFVIAYALVTRAMSEIGTRRLREARHTLAELRRLRPKPEAHVVGNIGIVAAKLAIASGDLARAADALEGTPTGNGPPGFIGEIYAYRSLIHAAAGDVDRAHEALRQSEHISRYIDSVAARAIANAILVARSEKREGEVLTYVDAVLKYGHRDMLVTGCRAFPGLAAVCARRDDLRILLAELFATSRDIDLARTVGIAVPRNQRRGETLSPREREILDLVSQGRTNRQIAATLFISESTTKVHVRHIFEKLGVHTRVEAAAMLKQID